MHTTFANPSQHLNSDFFEHDQFPTWLQEQKHKWRELRAIKRRRRNGEGLTDADLHQVTNNASIMKQITLHLQHKDWNILQIKPVQDTPGLFLMHVCVGHRMHRVHVQIARKMYIHYKKQEAAAAATSMKMTLPHGQACYTLVSKEYPEQLLVSETKLIHDLSRDDQVLAVYETQVPLLMRAILELGSTCHLHKDARSKASNV